jgi:4-hydroxy-tetrahydrodipicolinate synthase
MCKLALNGDFSAAADLQLQFIPLINALFSDVNPIPVKEAMNLMGLQVGPARLPLIPMADDKREILKAELKNAGLL